MGRLSRNKGKAFERLVANAIRGMGHAARRGVQYRGGPDSPDVVGIPGVHIECKHCARVNIHAAMRQAAADAGENVPVLIHRVNRGDVCLTVRLADVPTFWARWDESVRDSGPEGRP